MGEKEGGSKASGVAENSGGDFQGVGGGGIKSSRVTNNPGVEELLRGGETSEVTLEGDRVPEMDGWGPGGDGNSPATRDTKGNTATSRGKKMSSGQEPVVPPSAPQGTANGVTEGSDGREYAKAFQCARRARTP